MRSTICLWHNTGATKRDRRGAPPLLDMASRSRTRPSLLYRFVFCFFVSGSSAQPLHLKFGMPLTSFRSYPRHFGWYLQSRTQGSAKDRASGVLSQLKHVEDGSSLQVACRSVESLVQIVNGNAPLLALLAHHHELVCTAPNGASISRCSDTKRCSCLSDSSQRQQWT